MLAIKASRVSMDTCFTCLKGAEHNFPTVVVIKLQDNPNFLDDIDAFEALKDSRIELIHKTK